MSSQHRDSIRVAELALFLELEELVFQNCPVPDVIEFCKVLSQYLPKMRLVKVQKLTHKDNYSSSGEERIVEFHRIEGTFIVDRDISLSL